MPRVFFGAEADPVAAPMSLEGTSRGCARRSSARSAWPSTGPRWSRPRGAARLELLRRPGDRAARARVSIMAVLVGSPSWAAGDQAYAPATAAGRPAFARFVGDVVKRYGHGGRFWRTHRSSRGACVRLPGVERAELSAALGRGPVARRVTTRLLKEQARVIRALRPQGQDRHGGPPGQLHPRAAGVPLPGRSLQGAGDQAGVRRGGRPPLRRERAGSGGRAARIRSVMRSNGDGRPRSGSRSSAGPPAATTPTSPTPPRSRPLCSGPPSASCPATASATT